MIRAFLIDDEPLALSLLRRKLEDSGQVEVIGAFTEPESLKDALITSTADAVFADIEMGTVSGLDLAEEIISSFPWVQIVFVTGHSDYAVQAFEIESVDYILKPITARRLEKTLDRLKSNRSQLASAGQEHPASTLNIKVFGDFVATLNGQPLIFKTSKVKELFAYFILNQNRQVHRDVLIEALWPDHEYKKAKIHLHTCLSYLRKLLKSCGLAGSVSFTNPNYIFNAGAVTPELDMIELSLAGTLPAKEIDTVIHSYTGRLFGQSGYPWADDKAEQYQRHVILLLDRLVDYYQDRNLSRALEYLQIQQSLDPYLDRNIRNSMLLLAQQGNRPKALQLYEEYARLLYDDLGVDPDGKLTELYELLAGR
ncbi:response regulator [Bhargavaea cecembensis]|uniref:response regulator n=1 Tax=Bhargavaea cecembensis TaxID=394098 RepID=UPI0005913D45|nr:response regulator [Bhargavaea cecembensis]